MTSVVVINSDRMKIYVSYNNLKNSFDYPAMFPGTIGVGTTGTKDTDRIFVSNRIIIWGKNGISEYEGNSFLTPYVMIKELLDK